MDFLKEWATVVCGTIMFAALCEVLIPKGACGKYIKLILGMVLTLSLIKPFENIFTTEFLPEDYFAFEARENFEAEDEKEREYIFKIYKEKLEESITKRLKSEVGEEDKIKVSLEISNDKERFGEIEFGKIIIYQKYGFRDYREKITKIMETDFGVLEERLALKFVKSTGGE